MTACQAAAATAADDGVYVYCVARSTAHWLLGPIGLDDKMAYTVPNGDLCCVVHSCDARPYQSDNRQLAEGWVLAHQRVVDAATKAFGTVLPMSFNMIVRDGPGGPATENLRTWMTERRDGFTPLLDKLAGKAEYGVQIFWDRRLVADTLVQKDPKLRKMRHEALNKPKGTAYMLQQKLAKATRAAIERRANRYVEDFYLRVRRCVEEMRIDRPRNTDNGARMLLRLSCLMKKGSSDLGRALDEIQKMEGISVRFTGPWPPYSFVGGG